MVKEYRFQDNPNEKVFVEEFSKFSDLEISQSVTGTLDGVTPRRFLSEDEIDIVKGTIQWLGSPVGHGFLKGIKSKLKFKL